MFPLLGKEKRKKEKKKNTFETSSKITFETYSSTFS